MGISFRVAASSEDRIKAFVVRYMVFCGEQGIPYNLERDVFEMCSIHVLGEIDDEPVAAGRLRLLPDHAKLERIAVLSPYRGQGFGVQLTQFLMSVADKHGFSDHRLNAQTRSVSFYKNLGFRAVGEIFLDAEIEHVLMIRTSL